MHEVEITAQSLSSSIKIVLEGEGLNEQRLVLIDTIRDLEVKNKDGSLDYKIKILDEILNLIDSFSLVSEEM
ncbi:MAG: hypothetical protein CBE07_001540 [Pelagibacteraceae bacterium TMED247]|nr:MAG: hypothetical protein CBE07_001540 [Pelagibacteraceae bacterium TMED247]